MAVDFHRFLMEEIRRTGETDRSIAAVTVIFRHYRNRMEQRLEFKLPKFTMLHQDILMETMIRIHTKRFQLLNHPYPVHWVFRVLDYVRMEKLKEETRYVNFEDQEEEVVSSDIRSDDKLRRNETWTTIRKAMEQLRPQEYLVFEKYHFDRMDPEEIALELDIAQQTAYNLLSKSRIKVLSELEKLYLNK